MKAYVLWLAFSVITVSMVACAGAPTNDDRVYHGFSIEVAKGAGPLNNLRYLYGDLGWRNARVAAPPGPLSILRLQMVVPETFVASWEGPKGEKRSFTVPVRSRLTSSVRGKTVHFLLMDDDVEGYLVTPEANFRESRERFYP